MFEGAHSNSQSCHYNAVINKYYHTAFHNFCGIQHTGMQVAYHTETYKNIICKNAVICNKISFITNKRRENRFFSRPEESKTIDTSSTYLH
jgi:hypothetical protein